MSHQESLSQLFPEHELPSPFSQSPKEAHSFLCGIHAVCKWSP